eukprot:scaffold17589_cov154-Skeletonema_dohrnii-CCMP3373.AAC.2
MIVQGKAVISVSCVQVQEHEGLGRKRNDAASQEMGVDGLCDYRFVLRIRCKIEMNAAQLRQQLKWATLLQLA